MVGIDTALQAESQTRTLAEALQGKVDALVAALEKSREKLKGREQAQQDRERFQEQVQLDGEAVVAQAVHAAEARLLQAQQRHEDEVARLQAQLDSAQNEIDRLQEQLLAARPAQSGPSDFALAQAKAEGERAAQALGAVALDVAHRAAAEATRAVRLLRPPHAAKLTPPLRAKYEEQIAELQSQLAGKMDETAALKAQLAKLPNEHVVEKLRAQLAVIRDVNARARGEASTEKGDAASLDSLEAWLLESNQRLQSELTAVKELLAKAEARLQHEASTQAAADVATAHVAGASDDALSLATLRSQRDRLRAVVERRDVTIEQLQNGIEDRDQKTRTLEGEVEALKQRIRFLQSYKVSERSTLVGGVGKDVEAQLGRGVSHQFRGVRPFSLGCC